MEAQLEPLIAVAPSNIQPTDTNANYKFDLEQVVHVD